MRPICVPCQRFFRPIKNGFHFIEGMPVDGAVPGMRIPITGRHTNYGKATFGNAKTAARRL
jgi:hypothetical protein